MSTSAAIETHELRKAYADLVALDGVDLSVEPGSVFGLLGPTGAVAGFDVAREAKRMRDQTALAGQYARGRREPDRLREPRAGPPPALGQG